MARLPCDGLAACLAAFIDCFNFEFAAALALDKALELHELDALGCLNLTHFLRYATLANLSALAHCHAFRWLVLLAMLWHVKATAQFLRASLGLPCLWHIPFD